MAGRSGNAAQPGAQCRRIAATLNSHATVRNTLLQNATKLAQYAESCASHKSEVRRPALLRTELQTHLKHDSDLCEVACTVRRTEDGHKVAVELWMAWLSTRNIITSLRRISNEPKITGRFRKRRDQRSVTQRHRPHPTTWSPESHVQASRGCSANPSLPSPRSRSGHPPETRPRRTLPLP